ncbi:thioredoxin domain-containing protein [Alphaproteobacteria bacterium]|nr:thioredoxin domain-containing protein [Alphaproteobacteria bacterium]
MGLYTKKKTFLSFKNIFFIVLIGLIIYFYFFLRSNDEHSHINKLNKIPINESNQSIALEDLEKFIENFISENPKLIIDTVRNYQTKQSQIIKNETANQNLKLISQLKLLKNDMFFGFNETDKIIYEFVDYNCGYCQKFHEVLLKLIDKKNDIRIEILQLPILSESSVELAKIVIASSFSGDFNKVHNYLYSKDRRYDIAEIFADLFLIDVDIKIIKKNMNSPNVTSILNKHKELSMLFKLNGTPAIIIGRQVIPGYIELPKLIEILSEEFPNNS